MRAFRQSACCSAAIATLALPLAPVSTAAAPSERARVCLLQTDFEAVFASIPVGHQMYIKSSGPENQDYLAVLVGHGIFAHPDDPPQSFHEPAFVLVDIQTCSIVHAFELQPRNQAASEHFLVFNAPQDQIAIFSKWKNSFVSGDEIQRKQGAVAASYSYRKFTLRTVTRYADGKYFPTERLLVDEAGLFGYFPCWYPELCKIRMRNLEFVNRFVIADKSFEALGLQGERGVKLYKPDKSARDALGDSAPNPDGVLIRLHGVDAAGERRQVNYSTAGEPVYTVLSPAAGDSYFATVRDFEQTYGLQVTRFRVRGIQNPEQDWSSETLYDDPKGNETFIDSELLKQIEQVDIFPRYKERLPKDP